MARPGRDEAGRRGGTASMSPTRHDDRDGIAGPDAEQPRGPSSAVSTSIAGTPIAVPISTSVRLSRSVVPRTPPRRRAEGPCESRSRWSLCANRVRNHAVEGRAGGEDQRTSRRTHSRAWSTRRSCQEHVPELLIDRVDLEHRQLQHGRSGSSVTNPAREARADPRPRGSPSSSSGAGRGASRSRIGEVREAGAAGRFRRGPPMSTSPTTAMIVVGAIGVFGKPDAIGPPGFRSPK